MMALAGILCIVLCFAIASLVTTKKAPPTKRIKYLVLLAFLTVFCSLVNYKVVSALNFSGIAPPDTVTIEATDTKNDASKETSVYLTGLFVDGQSVPIRTTGDGTWLQDGSWYKWYGSSSSHYVSGTPQSMSISVPAGSNRYLTFLGNVWKGIGSVACLGETQVVDFYAPEDTTIQVRLPDSPAAVLRTLQTVRLVIAALLLAIELALAVWVLLREAAKEHVPKERECWLDVLKLLASYLIVVIHSVGTVYNLGPDNNSSWFSFFLLNVIPRCAVPVFLLATGIFVLGKPMGTKKWVKKLVHFLLLLLFWNAFYIILDMLLHHRDEFSLTALLRQFAAIPVKRGPSDPLWYAYQLVWIYSLAPFFFKLYSVLDRTWRQRLILVSLLIPCLLSCYDQVFDLGGQAYSHSFVQIFYIGFMGFLFLGRYLYDYAPADNRLKKAALPLIVLGFGLTMLLSWLYLVKHGKVTHQYFSELSIGPLLYGTGVFILFYRGKPAFQNMPEKLRHAVSWLAERAIGIYFLHHALIWYFGTSITIFGFTISRTGAWWSAILYTMFIWCIAAMTVSLLSYLPGIRKLVT